MSGAHILVVDDDRDLRQAVSELLTDEGFEVMTAPDGRAALALVEQQTPDLILLDSRMPVMNGQEFAQAYQLLPGPHAPVVAMTATVSPDLQSSLIADIVTKPFDLDEFLTVVWRHAGV